MEPGGFFKFQVLGTNMLMMVSDISSCWDIVLPLYKFLDKTSVLGKPSFKIIARIANLPYGQSQLYLKSAFIKRKALIKKMKKN